MEAISSVKDFKLRRNEVLSAVRDVSFNLYRGAVVGLVGESGSGKSTVAKLLAGQEALTSGDVRLDGQPVALTTGGTSASTKVKCSWYSRTRSRL